MSPRPRVWQLRHLRLRGCLALNTQLVPDTSCRCIQRWDHAACWQAADARHRLTKLMHMIGLQLGQHYRRKLHESCRSLSPLVEGVLAGSEARICMIPHKDKQKVNPASRNLMRLIRKASSASECQKLVCGGMLLYRRT